VADHTQTIAAATGVLGASEPNVWAAYNWNAFNWGYTGDFALTITKGIDCEALTLVDAQGKDVTHPIDETTTPDSATGVLYLKMIAEAFASVAGDLASEELSDQSGYKYVFPDRATNAEDRDFTSWTAQSTTTTTWTTASAVSGTSWT
jgi:hypothetical protein